MKPEIKQPIVLLGAARSGTHLLSRSLSQHPDIAYISEPNYIWKAYNAAIGHDMIPAACATASVRDHIHARFEQLRAAQGRSRLCEKTPANALRLPFVLEVFPDAKLVHVVRDGRHVAISARRKFLGAVGKITTAAAASDAGPGPEAASSTGRLSKFQRVGRRVRQRLAQGVPLVDLPYYLPKALGSALRMTGLRRQFPWGPEFPGMRGMMRTHSLIEICALQWQLCVEGVLNVVAARPDVAYYQVEFRRLIEDNEQVTREIFDFAELPQPDRLQAFDPRGFDLARDPFEFELDANERQIVLDRISATLARLGYLDTPVDRLC